jgi:hypothetical protein
MTDKVVSRLNVQLPVQLLTDLEDLRYTLSRRSGRRVSTRALAQEAIAAFLQAQAGEGQR